MSELMDLHPALFLTLPLGLALGIDLYLTLILIGLIAHLEWVSPPPGRLGDLSSLPVLFVPILLYLAEITVERLRPLVHSAWHAGQAPVRPLGAILLGFLLLHGQNLPVLLTGAVVMGSMASLAHAAKVGAGFLRRTGPPGALSPWVAEVVEDTLALVLVAVSLDSPRLGFLAGLAGVALLVIALRGFIRAFAFAMRATRAAIVAGVTTRGWTDGDRLPRRVRKLVATTAELQGPILRGTPIGCRGMPGGGVFRSGWLLIGGEHPYVTFAAFGTQRLASPEGLLGASVEPGQIVTRIAPGARGDGAWLILVTQVGPSPGDLAQSLSQQ